MTLSKELVFPIRDSVLSSHVLAEISRQRLDGARGVFYHEIIEIHFLDEFARKELSYIKMHEIVNMALQDYGRRNIERTRYVGNIFEQLGFVERIAERVHIVARYFVAAHRLCPDPRKYFCFKLFFHINLFNQSCALILFVCIARHFKRQYMKILYHR